MSLRPVSRSPSDARSSVHPSPLARVCDYNAALLAQVVTLLAALPATPAFTEVVGPQLRHVIEHYESLLAGILNGVVDYEHRARDRSLEATPAAALERCESLIRRLQCLDMRLASQAELAIEVVSAIGIEGEGDCRQRSTVARELMFLASHTTHHYAIVKPALVALGASVPADFGKAPGTVRHEKPARAQAA